MDESALRRSVVEAGVWGRGIGPIRLAALGFSPRYCSLVHIREQPLHAGAAMAAVAAPHFADARLDPTRRQRRAAEIAGIRRARCADEESGGSGSHDGNHPTHTSKCRRLTL